MTEEKTETLKSEVFCPSPSVRKLQNWDSCLHCLAPNSVPFQLNLTSSQGKEGQRPRQWERMYLGRRATERGHMSRQVTRNTKARGEMRGLLLSSVHPCSGVDGGAVVRVPYHETQQPLVRQQEKTQKEESLGDKSLFHGLCCPCNAGC